MISTHISGYSMEKNSSLLSVCLVILTIHVSLPHRAAGITIILYNYICDSKLAFPFIIIKVIKSRKMGLTSYVVCVHEMRNSHIIDKNT